ncbi:MAG: hypothetical protein RBR52_00265 [Thiomonas sp.]|uniref:hypothetical protein n=1 Tax=Thiomonas sp. TaxID=2047785 RepID=UPI002A35BEF1|nr:hypothetical protein [Thiomonas sp.]MDY0328912.1 hypothetical protein [Thiomonas sp.]
MSALNDQPQLRDFVDLREMLGRDDVRAAFPTEQSLRWFVRNHRSELVQAGALIALTNRLKFHPANFQRAAVDIGQRVLLRRDGLAA